MTQSLPRLFQVCGLFICIFDPALSLDEQLISLAGLAFLLHYLDFTTGAHTKFIPNQLYHDMQAVVKNAFFTVAKVRNGKVASEVL